MGGGVPIPFVPAVQTLSPSGTDDGPAIQAALDFAATQTVGSNGFRGAVLLTAGSYQVANTLNIASGVILRGEGSGTTGGTTVTYTSTTKSTMILAEGANEPVAVSGTTKTITDAFVPTGAKSFALSDTTGYAIGDDIIVQLTPNSAWLSDMSNMAQWGWSTGSYQLIWRRVVTNVSGNVITIDAPIVQAIDTVLYGGANVYKYTFVGEIDHIGIENIRLESSYASDTDENHGWKAIQMRKVSNSFVRQVTAKYFGYGAVSIESRSSYITVEDSAMLEHKGTTSGGRRYSFNIDDSDFIMMQRCLTQNGRHDYVAGSRTPGPNVFVDSLALDSINDIGPHHRYSTGQLYDNIKSVRANGDEGWLYVQNREDSGSGHGWSGAQIMFWNNEAAIVCDAPNNAMNYAIGNVGSHSNSTRVVEKNGIQTYIGTHVTPRSLYYAQLKDRLSVNGLRHVIIPAQDAGPIWTQLETWYGNGLFLDPLVLYVDEAAIPASVGGAPLEIGGIVRDLTLLGNTPTFGWTQVSGPGTTTFGDATSLATTASFSASGNYVLQLSASDGSSTTHTATITVGALVPGSTSSPTTAPSLAPTTSPSLKPSAAPSIATNPVYVLSPTDDTYIVGGEETSYSTSNQLRVKEKKPWVNRLNLIRRAFFEFDLSSVSITSGTVVTSAKLKLMMKGGQNGNVQVCPAGTFVGSSATWSNPPSYDCTTPWAEEAHTTGDVFMEFEVGPEVNALLQAGSTTVNMAAVASTYGYWITFYSQDHSNSAMRPTLTVTTAFERFALTPSEDTTARASSGDANEGSVTRVSVKKNDDRYGYYKFDVTDITLSVNPPTILLRLWAYTNRACDVNLHEMSSNWSEGTLTWNNKPTEGAVIETKPYPPQYQDMTFDVTAYVAQEIGAGATEVSFALTAFTDASLVKFYSKEWSDSAVWPTLEFGELTV